ncbi:MAG: superinfection immunity protein [Knoellia sp.]
MSDDQQSMPTEPYAAGPPAETQAMLPYAQHAPPPTPHAPAMGVPVGGAYTNTTMVAARVGPVHVVFAWVFAVFTLGYFLPWAIAATRQRSNSLAIGLLNFLVGWTVIGWIAALVMAVQSEPTQVTNVAYAVAPVMHVGPQAAPAGWYPDQFGGRRYWDGQQWTQHTAP